MTDRQRARRRQPGEPARGGRAPVLERRRAPSRSPRGRRPSGSAIPAGRPTAGSPRRTPTRTGTAEDEIHIVLNGIIENHAELRRDLQAEGHEFTSETDAEIVSHLIERHYDGDLTEAVRKAFGELRGHYAFVAMHRDQPDTLVAARKECPLIIGLGENENFIASAIPAFLAETRTALGIKNDEIVTVHKGDVTITDAEGNVQQREPEEVTWDEDAAEKGGYDTFMLKEIHEQPDAVAETITDRLPTLDGVDLSDVELDDDFLRGIERIVIVACGTSYHSGLIGRYAIERWARVPVEMDIASEYRYREPVQRPNDLVIGITQSGETADTLAAMRLAREGGSKVLAITNVMGSQATRDADAVLFTRSGHRDQRGGDQDVRQPGRGDVPARASASRSCGARCRRSGSPSSSPSSSRCPRSSRRRSSNSEEQVRAIAAAQKDQRFFMYIGRHIGLAVCLEGALKLKEIAYIPADAYAAGEMKHGPIALLDESTPVVAVATDSPVVEKMLSNMEEVRARGADVIAVATEGSDEVAEAADQTLFVPRTDWILQPIVAIVPLQLLAYYIAREKGLNVDQPRNLAKTVTVE